MTKAPGASLASLNTVSASATAHAFEYVGPDGSGTGITLRVLGAQAQIVTEATNRLINERRRQEAVRTIEAGASRPGDAIMPVEDDIAFGQRLAAIRLVGWEGIEDDWTADNALLLCQTNADVSAQVLAQSNKVGNFTRASRKG